MADSIIRLDEVGKKFCRDALRVPLYAATDTARRWLGRAPGETLRRGEFWALRGVSLSAEPGQCIGIIGPNGAGKSTLLKLIDGDLRPSHGHIETRGAVSALLRLNRGLQPLLTGRENIYIRCAERRLGKRETDALLDDIVAFAGLEKSLDRPVRHYSEGMYARLEFAITTAIPPSILLIDEVLAVGDVAFQVRCLERLDQLKQAGSIILFVSHSEMNIRQVADFCLLLFDGEALAFGQPDALFRSYYDTLGFSKRGLPPTLGADENLADLPGPLRLTGARLAGTETTAAPVTRGHQPLRLTLDYVAETRCNGAQLLLEFWNPAGLRIATFDSSRNGGLPDLVSGVGILDLELPFFGLAPGIYRIAGGFRASETWLSYCRNLLRLTVTEGAVTYPTGLVVIPGRLGSRPPPA